MPFSNDEHVKYKRLLEIQKELEAAKKMNELTQYEVVEWLNAGRRNVLIDITSGSYTFMSRKGRTRQMNDNEYRLFQAKFHSDSSVLNKEHAAIVLKTTEVAQKIENMKVAQNRCTLFSLQGNIESTVSQGEPKGRARSSCHVKFSL